MMDDLAELQSRVQAAASRLGDAESDQRKYGLRLDDLVRIVKVNAFVYGEPGFNQPSVVAEGCSDLLMDLYGEKGRHARSAVTVAALTMDICCEIEMIVEVAPHRS